MCLCVKQREKSARPNHTAAVLPHSDLIMANCDDKVCQNKDPACLKEWKQNLWLFGEVSPAKYDFLWTAQKLKCRAEECKAHINTAEQELCSNVKLPNKWLGNSQGHPPNFAAVINQDYCHVSPYRTRTNCSFKYFSGRHKSVFMATLGRYGGRLANMKIKSSLGRHPNMLNCVES